MHSTNDSDPGGDPSELECEGASKPINGEGAECVSEDPDDGPYAVEDELHDWSIIKARDQSGIIY
jgi:hypothetical protein